MCSGANTGIGKVAAHEFAEMGAHVILASRSEEKTKPVVEEIIRDTQNTNVEFMKLELGDFLRFSDAAVQNTFEIACVSNRAAGLCSCVCGSLQSERTPTPYFAQ